MLDLHWGSSRTDARFFNILAMLPPLLNALKKGQSAMIASGFDDDLHKK